MFRNGTKILKATGENLGLCISLLTSAVIALANAFYHGPVLTLLSLIPLPFLVFVIYWAEDLEERCSEEQDAAYGGFNCAFCYTN